MVCLISLEMSHWQYATAERRCDSQLSSIQGGSCNFSYSLSFLYCLCNCSTSDIISFSLKCPRRKDSILALAYGNNVL